MTLSTESILTIIGVLINLPPALLILWKLICHDRHRQRYIEWEGQPDVLGISLSTPHAQREVPNPYTSQTGIPFKLVTGTGYLEQERPDT
jgi:hypothetical protein